MSKIFISRKLTLDSIELLIRKGNIREARESLLQITKKSLTKINESDLIIIANLFRRVQLSGNAINLLTPSIRSYREKKYRPSLRLIAEYAMALHRIGNSMEAKLLLNDPLMQSYHYAQFYLGLISLTEWEYEKSQKYFTDFLNSQKLDIYERCLGELNLLATVIFLEHNHDKIEGEIIDLIIRLESYGFQLLASNAKEILIQYYASFGDLERNDFAKKNIMNEKLKKIISHENNLFKNLHTTIYSHYLQKWLCVNLMKTNPKKALYEFKELQKKAYLSTSWEVFRDCEFYIAKITNSSDRFNKLYFGTPYPAYRKYMLSRVKHFQPDENYLWSGGQITSKKSPVLDLSTFSFYNSHQSLATQGGVLHRILLSLLSDLFRPLTVGAIFSKTYLDEYYNHSSSGLKVRQGIFRLQKLLERASLAIQVSYKNGYSVEILEPLAIRLSRTLININKPLTKEELLLKQISNNFKQTPFSATELALFLGQSHSSSVRLLNKLMRTQEIKLLGKGHTIKYLIKQDSKV